MGGYLRAEGHIAASILSCVRLVPRRWQLRSGAAQKVLNDSGGVRSHCLCRSRRQSTLPLEKGVVSRADCSTCTGDPGPSCKRVLAEAQNQSANKTAPKNASAVPGYLVQKWKSRRQARNEASSRQLPVRHPSSEDGQLTTGTAPWFASCCRSSCKQKSFGGRKTLRHSRRAIR